MMEWVDFMVAGKFWLSANCVFPVTGMMEGIEEKWRHWREVADIHTASLVQPIVCFLYFLFCLF